MYEIVVGRNETDRKSLGTEATIPIAKHYVTMEKEKSLANRVLLDVNKPHVILVCGKRGSGKSYTLGVMTEGISNLPPAIKPNISTLIFDTLGIYWTMKYPNYRDDDLLREWELEPKKLTPKVFVPIGMVDKYKEKGVPVDKSFGIKPVEMSAPQWAEIFSIDLLSSRGILIEKAVDSAREKYAGNLTLPQIVETIKADEDASDDDKRIVVARFEAVEKWGLFDPKAPKFTELIEGGGTAVLDISAYSEEDNSNVIKALVIGHVCDKAMRSRMVARKAEELKLIKSGQALGVSETVEKKAPLLWIVIDEAHEFLPKEGTTLATPALITLLREGRQPGISLVLATQQPGKIHTDVLTQADIVLSHRLTAKTDIDALNAVMQSYLSFEVQKYIDSLPRVKGAGIILDDTLEKIYPVRIQPRISWHGGSDPQLIRKRIQKTMFSELEKKPKFEFKL